MEYRMGFLRRSWHDVPVLFQNPAWQTQTDTAVSLWVSRAKCQFRLRSSSWPFCSDSPEWRSRLWSRDMGVMATLSVRQKMPFFFFSFLFSCIYNPRITVSPTSSFSASFNGNRVKNHPEPWTCPLRSELWHHWIELLVFFSLCSFTDCGTFIQ